MPPIQDGIVAYLPKIIGVLFTIVLGLVALVYKTVHNRVTLLEATIGVKADAAELTRLSDNEAHPYLP